MGKRRAKEGREREAVLGFPDCTRTRVICCETTQKMQARQTLGNHVGFCKQQAHVKTVKQKFVFTDLDLHILYPFPYQIPYQA